MFLRATVWCTFRSIWVTKNVEKRSNKWSRNYSCTSMNGKRQFLENHCFSDVKWWFSSFGLQAFRRKNNETCSPKNRRFSINSSADFELQNRQKTIWKTLPRTNKKRYDGNHMILASQRNPETSQNLFFYKSASACRGPQSSPQTPLLFDKYLWL